MKLLIVDDEYSVVDALREYLTMRGYEVFGAGRWEEVVTVLRQEHPEVILLDIRLPGMSGMEILQKIRILEPRAQVIMITALDDANLRRDAMAAGAVGFAFKPLDVQSLERVIMAATRQPPPLAPKSPIKASQVTVLVVDDEPEICVALRYYLVGLGYKVLTAANGTEALKTLQEARPRPDIMLLDLSMPQKGGFAVLEELRQYGTRIPIVVMSAHDNETVRQATQLLGVRKFLQKPMPLPAIERTVREVLAQGPAPLQA